MLIQLKNAQAVGHEKTSVPFSKMNFAVAGVLKEAGFIDDFDKKKKRSERKNEITFIDVKLKYDDGRKKINDIKLVSKPSRRLYTDVFGIKPVKEGYGIVVLTTPKGVMSGEKAKKQKVGGEVLFEVW